jgi:phosphatidylglycerophosphate synthase
MRKIPRDLDNPIDNLLIDSARYVNPILKCMRFTPNMVTVMSGVCQFAGIHAFYNDYCRIAAGLFFLGYYWDVIDGNYARQYRMTSAFGDKLDHGKDVIVIGELCRVLYVYPFTMSFRYVVGTCGAFFTYMICMYLGAQERYYAKHNPKDVSQSLSVLTKVQKGSPETILQVSKWFNAGSANLFVSILMFAFPWLKPHVTIPQ